MPQNLEPQHAIARQVLFWLLIFLVVSAGYLYTFPQPNVFYAVAVLLHALGGVVATILLVRTLIQLLPSGDVLSRTGWLLIVAGALLGLLLIKTGTARSEWKWLSLHIVISLAGVGLLIADWAGRRGWMVSSTASASVRVAICFLALLGLGFAARYIRGSWQARALIQNP